MTLFQAFGQFANSGAVAGEGAMVFISSTSFSAASTVTLDDAFTSEYDNYRMLARFDYSNTIADVTIVMRSGGSSATGSNYDNQVIVAGSTSLSAARQTNLTYTRILTADNEGPTTAIIDILSPALAEQTVILSQYGDGDGTKRWGQFGARHGLATAYDGIQFGGLGANTITGRFDLYGMQKAL